jgi:uncharacterized phage protein (TIGR01671 family)
MREIKLRAWNVATRVMVDLKEITPLALAIDTDGLFIPFSDGLILMQYTGLHDKNGREIYEGDIIEYENANCGYGRTRQEEINRDVVPEITQYEDIADGIVWWKNGEVIGNIYENPELVKEG